MSNRTILVADRDRTTLAALRMAGLRLDFNALVARTAADALAIARDKAPRVAIVSLGLCEGEAYTLVRQMRQEFATSRIPILILAREGQEDAVATALELGAVDYLVQPMEEEEIAERIDVLSRWDGAPGRAQYVKAAGVVLDVDAAVLLQPCPKAPLTPCETEILRWLLTPVGRTYTRRQLLAAHRASFPPQASDRTVDAHVASLRRKLGRLGACVVTRRGVGYRFDERVAPVPVTG